VKIKFKVCEVLNNTISGTINAKKEIYFDLPASPLRVYWDQVAFIFIDWIMIRSLQNQFLCLM